MCRALLYASESLPVSSGTVSFHRNSSTVAHYQCDFILQLHVFKLHTPCVSAYSDRAQSGLLCIVLKACTSWLVWQCQTQHMASCVQGQLSVLLKCT